MPFEILGLHSDNGSEYVNHRTAGLLEKLRIEFAKSRERHNNDDARVEFKNGNVMRKPLGPAHIPRQSTATLNEFHRQNPNRYVNYHRPGLFSQVKIDDRERRTAVIDMRTSRCRMTSSVIARYGAIFDNGCDD